MKKFDFIVVGGGISGVSCVETLSALRLEAKTLLISASPLVKVATNLRQHTKLLEEFDVEERPYEWIGAGRINVSVMQGLVASVDSCAHTVMLKSGDCYAYSMLCVCTGGKPKLIADNHPYVLGIRDTETVQEFQKRVVNATRIVIVGNGGIATELVSELEEVEIVWVIKDSSITSTFVDPGAAEFFLQSRKLKVSDPDSKPQASKRLKYARSKPSDLSNPSGNSYGSALGPDWAADVMMKGRAKDASLQIESKCEVGRILTPEEYSIMNTEAFSEHSWSVYVELTNGKIVGCDFVVSATGVVPNVDSLRDVFMDDHFAPDGGMKVNERMETGIRDIFAAGDVCTTCWEPAAHWFQMRLWTQARQMGAYAAKCMVSQMTQNDVPMDFVFEMFAHVTKFFDFKVVLLGLYNGQRLGNEYEILLRMTKGLEFVKVIVKNGQIQGAILIGETDLEETMENLILNGTDVTPYGEDLLNPDIDIEDYFD